MPNPKFSKVSIYVCLVCCVDTAAVPLLMMRKAMNCGVGMSTRVSYQVAMGCTTQLNIMSAKRFLTSSARRMVMVCCRESGEQNTAH